MKLPLLTLPLSWIYGAAVGFRHKLFQWKILKTEEFDIPIICVGNLTVGGTGKTPHTEFLIEAFSHGFNVGIVSRGYKRKTKGFVLATKDSSYRTIGDEPKQMKLKFPHIPIAVCEKRAEGIHRLRELHPEVNLILLDDGFQHRYVEAWANILLTDYNNPMFADTFLPHGTLRDSKSQIPRANFVIVTKCPEHIQPIDIRLTINKLGLLPYQKLYFSRMQMGELRPLFWSESQPRPMPGVPVIAMAGIASPETFYKYLESHFQVIHQLSFPDHYAYKMSDLRNLEELLQQAPPHTLIVVTEKDAVKLTNAKKIPVEIQRRLYFLPIHVEFLEETGSEFYRQLRLYVKQNQKYSILHPE